MAKGKKEDEASDAGEVPTRAPRKPLPTTSTGTNLLIADSLVRGAAKLLRKDIGDRIERRAPERPRMAPDRGPSGRGTSG